MSPDDIRAKFSSAMSDMYRLEVPQYGTLLDLVADVNAAAMKSDGELSKTLAEQDEIDRLAVERHGAIRVGTAQELSTLRRIFRVMGMEPVGYYDLSVAGVPVHSTAFRPVRTEALKSNPFRVFTSLLRLELIQGEYTRRQAAAILGKREIFTARALELTERCELAGGLMSAEVEEFVAEVLETFRWHGDSTVDLATYDALHDAHRLVADVVCFRGAHINHLTPRTLDIDAAQAEMVRRGLGSKDVIEGPPRRKHPILLRQTSFKALEESVKFQGESAGTHTARFGEIEQRGMALTREGRRLYDRLLSSVRDFGRAGASGSGYAARLEEAFSQFPDDLPTIRTRGLAFFEYQVKDEAAFDSYASWDLDLMVKDRVIAALPVTYEDFLPVSAAGIFQSNLGDAEQKSYSGSAAQSAFESDLGCAVLDEIALYETVEVSSIGALEAAFEQRRLIARN